MEYTGERPSFFWTCRLKIRTGAPSITYNGTTATAPWIETKFGSGTCQQSADMLPNFMNILGTVHERGEIYGQATIIF